MKGTMCTPSPISMEEDEGNSDELMYDYDMSVDDTDDDDDDDDIDYNDTIDVNDKDSSMDNQMQLDRVKKQLAINCTETKQSTDSFVSPTSAQKNVLWNAEHDYCNCVVTTDQYIVELLSKKIAHLQEVLCLAIDDTIVLLLRHYFDEMKVLDNWYSDTTTVQPNGQCLTITSTGGPPPPTFTQLDMCPITLEDNIPVDQCDALPCGHYVSCAAWKDYLTMMIDLQGPGCIFAECPMGDCTEIVRRRFIQRYCDRSHIETYDRYLMDAFISCASYIHYCPNPRCAYIVVANDARKQSTVVCHCGFAYCFCCLHEVHTPVPCDYTKEWLSDFIEDYTPAWLETNTKECPKCNTPIEKNNGCDHMFCDPKGGGCGKRFNWSEASTTRSSSSKKKRSRMYWLDHFAYAEHFVKENKNERLLRLKLEKVDNIVEQLQKRNGIDYKHITIFRDFFGVLLKGTRILKWSYVYEFYQKIQGNCVALIYHWRNETTKTIESLKRKDILHRAQMYLDHAIEYDSFVTEVTNIQYSVQAAIRSIWSTVDGIEDHDARLGKY